MDKEFVGLSGWVSLMVPCYNGERFVERFIRNIAEQTYSRIQLIFVDDGSSDRTFELFMQFRYLLEERDVQWEYYYQNNQGQAAAINTALSKVLGEFCLWLDVDDSITKDHIEKKVNKLSEDKELGGVICKGIAVDDRDPNSVFYELSSKKQLNCLFEDILFDYARCESGLYMVRSNLLFKALKGKSIYTSRVGQNFQLLLPITYQFKIGYIDEVLFFYRIRSDSHFHSIKRECDWEKRIELVEDVKRHVLLHMSMPEIYLLTLLKLLKIKILKIKIDKIIELSNANGSSKFASNVIKECLMNLADVSKRKLWIWGETKKNCRLAKLIEVYGKVNVEGFVDSNPNKIGKSNFGKRVIAPDDIDVRSMVLFIPIMLHEEIVTYLENKKFLYGKDYFYPEYEIMYRLKEYKNEICEEKRRM